MVFLTCRKFLSCLRAENVRSEVTYVTGNVKLYIRKSVFGHQNVRGLWHPKFSFGGLWLPPAATPPLLHHHLHVCNGWGLWSFKSSTRKGRNAAERGSRF